MNRHLQDLASKLITFDEFARRSARDWDRLAAKVYHCWVRKLPAGVSMEDIRQEMLLSAWIAVGEYDPSRGEMTLKQYVVYFAFSKALRFVHSQREAKRRDGKQPSRHPTLVFDTLGIDVDFLDSRETDTVDTDGLIDARKKFESAFERASGIDLYALTALRESNGSIPDAARMLFDEVHIAVHRRWGSPDSAANQIEKTLRALCAG